MWMEVIYIVHPPPVVSWMDTEDAMESSKAQEDVKTTKQKKFGPAKLVWGSLTTQIHLHYDVKYKLSAVQQLLSTIFLW